MSYRRPSIRHLDACLHALLKRGGSLGLGLGAFTPILALANPSGGQVVAGQATIGTPSANGMVINQASQSAIINWQQFNIGKGQYVQFLQPSSSAVVLNRVVGGSPSSILGTLSANGQVFLVNTNGVFFGKGASIDVQGFLASTIDITDSNFLSGNYVFDHGGAPDAKLVNQGRIRAHNGGYVVLAGDYAENTGIISAQSGHVILAAGSKATLDLNGNKLVHFAIDQATLSNYAGVKNAGSLIADGGTVIMTADVANALKATVVNNTGLIE
ncbi:MAG TPA: filamentous hemagglutinin N-terminal domain-containing protein, partial [Gammaproteobacteria bacterium]